MFTHIKDVKYTLPHLTRKNVDGVRKYFDDDGYMYDSTTSVVGFKDQDGLKQWRESVGEDVANYISRQALSLGSKLHEMVEKYLYDTDTYVLESNIFAHAHFNNIKPLVDNIDNIYGLETKLRSKEVGLAGTADCIAEYKGIPSIIDFKTSSKKKNEKYIEKYFLQAPAYSMMWEETTGIKIEQIVVLMTCQDGHRLEFIKDRNDYIQPLHDIIKEYRELQK